MSVKSSNYDNGSGSYYMVNNTSNKLFTWGEPDRGGSIEATQWSKQPDGVRINVKEAVMTPGGATFFIEIQIDGNGNVINQNEGKVAFTTPSGNSSWHGNLTTPSDTDFEKIYLAGNYMGFLAKKADNTFAGPAGTGLANLGDFITAVKNKKTLFFDVASNRNGIALLFND